MYKLRDGERDELQPQIILLESQVKERHFLHWTMINPSVTFQVKICNNATNAWIYIILLIQEFQRYNSDGPQVDINNESDQRFVWVIPVNQKGSNQFSLQPYNRDYFLKCGTTINSNAEKAIVAKGGKDEPDHFEFSR